MNIGIIMGGLCRELYSGIGSLASGVVNRDIDGIDTMLKNSNKEGYGLTEDCTAGLRKRIGTTVRKYINLNDPLAKRTGLYQLLHVINSQLPPLRAYYGTYSYSEAASTLIDCLEKQEIDIKGAL